MIELNKEFWKEVRCGNCRRLLAYEYIFNGRLFIKCPHCNEINKIEYKTPKNLIVKIMEEDEKTYNPDQEVIINRKVSISDLKGGEKDKSQ